MYCDYYVECQGDEGMACEVCSEIRHYALTVDFLWEDNGIHLLGVVLADSSSVDPIQ